MKQTHRIDRADCMNGEEDQEERKTFSREGFKTRRKQGKKRTVIGEKMLLQERVISLIQN